MTLSFDPETHEYRHGERRLASVTGILREVGLYDAHRFSKPQDRQRGEAVHLACRLIDAGTYDPASTHELIRPFAEQYQRFLDSTGFRALAWEVPMADVDLGVAGTWDTLGIGNVDELWLVDVKSGTVPNLVGVQLAGYEMLIRRGKLICPDPDIQKVIEDSRNLHIRRKSLNLATNNGRERLRSHDERTWDQVWQAAVTIYNTKLKYGKESNG